MAHVVIVGGSIAGLATALVLSGRGHDITVLERDPDPLPAGPEEAWRTWKRRSVAHLRGTHVFGCRGVQILRDHLPDVLAEVKAAGAREVSLAGPTAEDSVGLTRLACRRTTYEMALRTAALRRPAITLEAGCRVVGVLPGTRPDPAIAHVAGVVTGDGRAHPADLVVDATGRNSAAAGWLSALGAGVPEVESWDSGMAVNTRWYRLRDPGADPDLVQVDLGYGGWVLSPADHGMFSVTFGVFDAAPEFRGLRQPERFQAAASAVPAVAPWVAADVSSPDSGIRVLGHLPNRVRRLTDRTGRPAATGLVLLGDAAMCTNPRFGRGVSLALVLAIGLAETLDGYDDPIEVFTALGSITTRELEPWFHDAVARDAVSRKIAERVRAGEHLSSIGVDGDDPDVRLARATPFAVQHDPVVRIAYQRTWHLLDPPEAFSGNPEIRARVEEVWSQVQRHPSPPAGPDYKTMLGILAGR